MWTAISRFVTFSYEMIARLTHRTFLFFSGFRRFALPWSKSIDDKILPSDTSSACENQSLMDSDSNAPVSSSTTQIDTESTTVFTLEDEASSTVSQPPNKKCKFEESSVFLRDPNFRSEVPKYESSVFLRDPNFRSEVPKCSAASKKQELSKTKKKKIKGASYNKKIIENKDNEIPQSEETPRPNHFVAIQVSNSEIMEKVHLLQQKILSKEVTSNVINKFSKTANIFKDTMVKKEKLHFTLHVFHLKDDEEKERAKSALEKCYLKYKSEFETQPMYLNIEGLGHFRNGVIFAKILGMDHVSRLEALSEDIRREFTEMNIPGDQKPFRPHLTIAKLSKSKTLAKKKIRSYPLEIWSDFKAEHLGYQRVESLQLLSMMDTDPNTGYYGSIAQFHFHLERERKSSGSEVETQPELIREDDAGEAGKSSRSSTFENVHSKRNANSNVDDYIGEAKGNSIGVEIEDKEKVIDEGKEKALDVIPQSEFNSHDVQTKFPLPVSTFSTPPRKK